MNQRLLLIGPTASAAAAVVCATFAFLFWSFSSRQRRLPYTMLSVIAALVAAYTIYGALTKDPSLWPSEE